MFPQRGGKDTNYLMRKKSRLWGRRRTVAERQETLSVNEAPPTQKWSQDPGF